MSQLLPQDDMFGFGDDIATLTQLFGDVAELAELVPYIKAAIGAVRWYRNQRAILFFRALQATAMLLSPTHREEFLKHLRSKEGSKILADYSETVIRTSSTTAIAALALLYADVQNARYSPAFKLSAALALQGISETQVDAFLDLANVTEYLPQGNLPVMPYPVAIANDKLVATLPHTASVLSDPQIRLPIVRDLTNRGLLLPDFSSARFSDGSIGPTYGIGATTRAFVALLKDARALLPPGQSAST